MELILCFSWFWYYDVFPKGKSSSMIQQSVKEMSRHCKQIIIMIITGAPYFLLSLLFFFVVGPFGLQKRMHQALS